MEKTYRQSLREKKQILEFLFIGMLILAVIFLRIFYITRTSGPFIYADEFGYWAHAAHMMGLTWAGVMDGVSWYSFGYSFWLALTFLISNQMVIMYRAAIILNVLMSVGMYALAYGVIKKLGNGKQTEKMTNAMIAFVVTCFPTYIFYSYTTMSETLAAFVIWLLFYELVSMEENPIWWKGVLLGITSGYAYMVHNRLLTAVMAVCACLVILWILHRIDWKIIVSMIISLVLMMFFYVLMKGFLEGLIEQNQVVAAAQASVVRGTSNTFQSIWAKFLSLFTLDRIWRPLLSLWGQLWQCLSSTYLLAGFGVIYAIACLKQGRKNVSSVCGYMYPLIALLLSIGLTSVTVLGPKPGTTGQVRLDPAFYGRYNECYYPLLIMMALLMLCDKKWRGLKKICFGVGISYLALSVGMSVRLSGMEGYLNIVSAVGIHIFHWLGEFGVWKCFVIALFGGGVIAGLCCFRRFGQLGCYAGMLMVVFLFSTTALYCMRTSIRGENDYTNQYTQMYEFLNYNTQKNDVVYTCEENKGAFDLQSRLVNKAVVCIEASQLDNLDTDAYIVLREEQMDALPAETYKICAVCNEYRVIQVDK